MLIGLHGESRAGKDSVAKVLVQGYGFRQVALASKIREMLLEIDPWVEDDLTYEFVRLAELHKELGGNWDQIKAECRESVDLMIGLGQSARDIIGEDVWLNAAFPNNFSKEAQEHVVISDIRQPNEVEWVRKNGGELWLVQRPGTEKRGMDDLLSDVRFDVVIQNDGSLDDLEDSVDSIMMQDVPFKEE